MRVNDILGDYFRRRTRITIQPVSRDKSLILFEGTRKGLEFIGKLFLAQAQAGGCEF